jgi:signal transduction histidine kinase/ActR/RegA family two-component response regulator
MTKFESIKISVFGDTDQISSERYFVTASTLVAAIFLLGLCIVHIVMSLKLAPVILAGTSSLVMFGLYYFVRFRNCLYIPKVILTGVGLIMLDFTWYSKFLSNGPVLFFILIFAALVIWVWEGRCLLILLAFYFLNLAVLFYIDYNAPEILFKYPDPQTRSLDIFLSFFFYSILLIFLLYVIKREFLRQKGRAIMSDKLKSAFLANMSHEIRTPMNGILGFSELLKNPDLTGDQQQEYIRIIEKSGARMLNIINDIIDISKIEADLMNLDMNETDINEQIEYIYTFFRPEVEAKGLKLSFKNSLPDKEAIITTDREKLYAILTNLVKNAIKYTPAGSIEFGYVLTGSPTQLKELQFYVKDTGIGIPKDRKETIFDRFIQADIADLQARQGAGLGLSITKAYVEMLGGKISVDSEVEKGSMFTFTLPYNAKPIQIVLQKDLPAEKAVKHLKNLKILIVEDDKISEMLIDITVKTIGSEILYAGSGTEAVETCRNNPDTDLVLMDIQLPGLDGYEATRQIRQFNKKVVIIAQTAYALSGDMEKAIESGCNDYIAKPIKKTELLALIEKYLYKNQV